MGKYLKFYERCMKSGQLPSSGLCNCFGSFCHGTKNKKLSLFDPSDEEYTRLYAHNKCITYWGSGLSSYAPIVGFKFTPLRQNIVLLMAAMNNEFKRKKR